MRGTRAKLLRRAAYGDLSPRVRHYGTKVNGQLVADPNRRHFQQLKALWKRRCKR